MKTLFVKHWIRIGIGLVLLSAVSYLAFAPPHVVDAHPLRLTPTLAPTNTPTPTPTPTATPPPNPAIEQIVNLGIPAGNATAPRHLALDEATGLLYIFSTGIPVLNQGNQLTLYDTLTEAFTDQIVVNEAARTPLDLQLDPTSGYLYALWSADFGSDQPPTLTVIDSQSLLVLQELPDVRALASGDGLLYTLGADQLTVWNLSGTGSLVEDRRIDVLLDSSESPHLAVNPTVNRLYLAVLGSEGWQVEVLAADTLSPVNTYPVAGQVLNLLPNPVSGELFVAENEAGTRFVHRLSPDGEQLDPRYRLDESYSGGDLTLSPDGSQLFLSGLLPYFNANDEQETNPGLISLTLDEFVPGITMMMPTPFEAIAINEAQSQAFALYPFDNFLYQIDLEQETFQAIDTALEIRDILVDDATGELLVSDSGSRVSRLDGQTFAVLAEIVLPAPADSYGFKQGVGAGELALDKTGNRLYVSGQPAYVLEADSLNLVETLEPGGQFAVADGADTVYLSHCGLAVLDVQTLVTETVISGSTQTDLQLGPNPCVVHSKLDAENQRLYSLADNGVPGSNSGTLLQVYDLTLTPTQIFTDANISITHVTPDPANRRAFVSYRRETNQQVRTLAIASSTGPGYSDQLGSLTGPTLYSPTTNRLYASDSSRLLVLDADTLDVIGTTPLPVGYAYRPVAIDATTEKIYLIGFDGQLLIADGSQTATRQENLATIAPAETPALPAGPILALETLPAGEVLALINSGDDLYQDIRLFRTEDGQTWSDLSQTLPPHLSVQDMAVSPAYADDQTLFVALDALGETGGLYRSTDGGQSWAVAMTGLQDLSPTRLFISPNFGSTDELILANTGHAGLHLSPDGGRTWQPQTEVVLDDLFLSTADNAAAVSNKGILLASQFLEEGGGLFRATLRADGELTAWQPVLAEPLTLLAFAPDTPEGTGGQTAFGFGRGLWRSTGGKSWQPGGAGLVDLDNIQAHRFLFSPNYDSDSTAYLFFKDIRGEASGRFFRTVDGGASWQIWDNPPQSQRFTTVAWTPDGEFLFGDDETQITTISPATMTWADPPTAEAPFPLDDLAVSPDFGDDSTLFAISHAEGLFKSTDGGQRWEQIDFPVRSTSFEGYRLAVSPDFGEDQTLYIATGFSLHRSEDGGQTWQSLSSTAGQSGFEAEHIAVSPNFGSDDTLLASTRDAVFRSTDRGNTWRQVLTRPETAGTARVLLFDPGGDAAYAWFDYDSTLFISTNGGQRWTEQPGEPAEPFPTITAAISPDGVLMLRPDFFPDLFQISSDGLQREALTEVLPTDLSDVQTMAYTPEGALLLGGFGGLFQSDDDGQRWQSLNDDDLSDTTVMDVEIVGSQIFVVLDTGQIFVGSSQTSWQDISVVK